MRTVTVPVFARLVPRTSLIVRKKNPKSILPRPEDRIAWRYGLTGPNGELTGQQPDLVFRSPEDPRVWLSRDEYDNLILSLDRNHDLVFTTRNGYLVVSNPQEGQSGWKNFGNGRRFRMIFQSGSWVRETRMEVCHPHGL
jgi:hypothetical protein